MVGRAVETIYTAALLPLLVLPQLPPSLLMPSLPLLLLLIPTTVACYHGSTGSKR